VNTIAAGLGIRQRSSTAPQNRRAAAPCGSEHARRVLRSLLHRPIPSHGGHRFELDLGTRTCDEQRERIVDSRIAVDDDWTHGAGPASPGVTRSPERRTMPQAARLHERITDPRPIRGRIAFPLEFT
jgi:hypothetical protein